MRHHSWHALLHCIMLVVGHAPASHVWRRAGSFLSDPIALPEVSIKIGVSTWTVSISVQRSITCPRLMTYTIVKAIHLDAVGEGDIVTA